MPLLQFKILIMTDLTIYKNDYCISTDRSRLDINAIHAFLSIKAYWCLNIPLEVVKKAVANSLNFGVYINKEQIGYARIISDFSTIAYLGDVYIIEEFRGKGLSKWLLETIMNHSELQGLRRWILLTGDAHRLYQQFGWSDIADPRKWMELHNKNVYSK
jgi:GNAT superfamily N-acetyltransferase